LLQEKRDVFLENLEGAEIDNIKEEEAIILRSKNFSPKPT